MVLDIKVDGASLGVSTFFSTTFILLILLPTCLYFLHASFRQKQYPFHNLPGPKRLSWLMGNVLDTRPDELEPGSTAVRVFRESQCHTIQFPIPLGKSIIRTTSPEVMSYILNESNTYQRSASETKATKILIGEGLVANFGPVHKRQRKVLTPAFNSDRLKNLLPVFQDCTRKTVLGIEKELAGKGSNQNGKNVVDVLNWCGRSTLDIIGKAGFDYDFQAVEQGPNGKAVRDSFNSAMGALVSLSVFEIIMGVISLFMLPSYLKFLPISKFNIRILKMRRELIKVSTEIIRSKSIQVSEELTISKSSSILESRNDILHLCMRYNLSLPPNERQSDKELAGQIVTFIFAGAETSAATVSWALYYLSQNPGAQESLHKSLSDCMEKFGLEDPKELNWDQLNGESLEFLDNVLNETLRLKPPVQETKRTCIKSDVIHLSERIKGLDGQMIHSIPVPKGTGIDLCVAANSKDTKYFGPNVEDFVPSRFSNLPMEHSKSKFPPSKTFSFNTGPKSCIGSRFAMVEMKVILLDLIWRFKFEPCPDITIRSVDAIVQRSVILGREKEGSQMPLVITKRISSN